MNLINYFTSQAIKNILPYDKFKQSLLIQIVEEYTTSIFEIYLIGNYYYATITITDKPKVNFIIKTEPLDNEKIKTLKHLFNNHFIN